MRAAIATAKIETKLFFREFYSFFFTFIFPPLMLILFGSIYGNEPSIYFNGQGSMDVSAPAYCAMVAGVTGLMSLPMSYAEYKEKNIYKRFDATPIGKGRVMVIQFMVHFLMTMLGFGMLILVAKLIYNIQIEGSALVIIGAMILSAGAMFSIGFLITALARDKKISDLLCYVFYFIMIFASGATIPREIFPKAMRNISQILPMTHAVDLLQGAFRGTRVSQLWLPIVTLSMITIFCTLIGMVIYRRKSWT